MSEFHKVVETVKEHKLLFAAVAGIVIVYFLWPSSATSSANNNAESAEEASIATASAANASLVAAQDQVNIVGLNDAATVQLDAQDNAGQLALGTLSAQIDTLNSNNQVLALQDQNSTQMNIAQDVLASQTSAQTFVESLEDKGEAVPQNISTAGAIFQTAPPAAPVFNESLNPWAATVNFASGIAPGGTTSGEGNSTSGTGAGVGTGAPA